MPSLAELTDYYPQATTGLPVENSSDVQLSTGEGVPTRITVRPEPRPEPDGRSIRQKLMGEFGERYQLWPEKIVREGLAAAGDVMKEGTLLPGLRREDFTDIPKPDMPTKDSTWLGKLLAVAPVAAQPGDSLIEKAQAISALAGTGGLAGADATLGSAPFLRPALKYKDKLYKGKEGQQHQDVIPKELYPEFERMAMSGEDISHYNFGFVNEKGHFLNREKALEHAINTGLVDKFAGQYGALTSTLMADSSKPGIAIEAMKANPFYSALEHNVGQISQNKMTGDQWLGTLVNKPGIKPEEMQWTGLQEFLQSKGKEPVTKEQIQEHLQNNKVELKEVNKRTVDETSPEFKNEVERILTEADKNNIPIIRARAEDLAYEKINQGDVKYKNYQLPGGENYREMLLTLPNKTGPITREEGLIEAKAFSNRLGEDWNKIPPARQEYFIEAAQRQLHDQRRAAGGFSKDTYQSSHWDEPNILAHVRMNDRTIDGKKSLHLEEIQSDWHQQGRDKGYKITQKERDRLTELFNKKDNLTEAEGKEAHELAQKIVDDKGVPDAPFKKSWHELALKRMIREAAEKGYSRLSWTPGEAQAARYDLSKSINKLEYNAEQKTLFAFDKNGKEVLHEVASPDKLSNFIGKDAAKKLLDQPKSGKYENTHKLEGQDLKIGGEGMKGFYDKMIPAALEKIGKEHGVKVKQTNIGVVKRDAMGKELGPRKIQPIHYIDIPQSLRDAAMHKGFPLFSKGFMFQPVDHNPFEEDKSK